MAHRPEWLTSIEELLPDIVTAAKQCEELFQQKCFELLLMRALGGASNGHLPSRSQGRQTPALVEDNRKIGNFLERSGLDPNRIADLIDFDTGAILVSDLGKNKAERQRKIAALIALRSMLAGGEFKVPKDKLIEQCKHFDAYDPKNFASNMKTTVHNDARVFVQDQDGWKVSGPGESFIVATVKGLRGIKNEG